MRPAQTKSLRASLFVLITAGAYAQPVEVVPVRLQAVAHTQTLPGELLPYQQTAVHARVNGYVEKVLVDRGTFVQAGQLLATISAPELASETAQAEAKVKAAESAQVEAEARLAAATAAYERLKTASATPGAISGLELVQSEKAVDAGRAAVLSTSSEIAAAKAFLATTSQSEQYMRVVAPFAGVITKRMVHPGTLVGPGTGAGGAIVELEQVARLRLVVAVPETLVASVRAGSRVEFRVPAYPSRTFIGKVARINRSLDATTRSMPVELEVANPRNELAPGMYPQVAWTTWGQKESLLVPPTAVVTTTERTFVIRVRSGRAEWVDVRKGPLSDGFLQVTGSLAPGDLVVRRATDEIREGSVLKTAKPAKAG